MSCWDVTRKEMRPLLSRAGLPQGVAELHVEPVQRRAELTGALGPFQFRTLLHDFGVFEEQVFAFGALRFFAFVLRPAHHVITPGFEQWVGRAGARIGLDTAEAGARLGLGALAEDVEERLAKLNADAVCVGAGEGFAFGLIEQVFTKVGEVLPDVGGDGLIQRR